MNDDNPIWDYLWLPVGFFLLSLAAVLERQLVWWLRVVCVFLTVGLAIPALIGFVATSIHDKLEYRRVFQFK